MSKLRIAEGVRLPLDWMTLATVVYGARGSGKTTLGAVVAEEVTKAGQRFWERVSRSVGCWLWTGARRNGYGVLWLAGHLVYAHRLSFVLYHGALEDGLVVCHHCDVPLCVRPDDLFAGSRADNNADMRAKGRARYAAPRGALHPRARLSDFDLAAIRRGQSNEGMSQRELGRRYGVGQSCIWQVVNFHGRFARAA